MNGGPSNFIRLYLVAAVACVVTGWGLSVLHELTPAGFAVALPLVAAGLAWLVRDEKRVSPPAHSRWRLVLFRRFRRPLPLFFFMAAVLVLIGGTIHPPNNFDALTYRLPRMLNWIAARRWIWIPTANDRMNYSGVGWEWMALPLLMLRSDRGLFLINAAGFLLLPGLIFSVFRQAGIARRVAWAWMWILPLAYGCATQGGSIGNDLTGTIFCLMSVHYGLRARRSGRVEDVWLAGLAAALMTGVKTSNLPLLLPCLAAVWPALKHLGQRRAAGILVVGIGFLVSAVPIVALNQKHTGDWTGDPQNRAQIQVASASAAFLGNGLLLMQQSLMPPVLPGARKLDAWLNQHLPAAWKHKLETDFPRYFVSRLNELPQEEGAGLGLGITLLLLTAIGAAACGSGIAGGKIRPARIAALTTQLVGLAASGAGLFFMSKMGSEADARLMLPYYPLAIIPILALPGQDRLVRRRGWRTLAVLASLSILPGLILTPSRPLWPAQAASAWLSRHHPESAWVRRLTAVYLSYNNRNDLLAPLRAGLPDNAANIGFIAGNNDTEYSLWRPFGQRRVTDLQADTRQPPSLPADIEWLVVKRTIWPEITDLPLEEWAAQHRAEIVSSVSIVSLANAGEETWCLLRIRKP